MISKVHIEVSGGMPPQESVDFGLLKIDGNMMQPENYCHTSSSTIYINYIYYVFKILLDSKYK